MDGLLFSAFIEKLPSENFYQCIKTPGCFVSRNSAMNTDGDHVDLRQRSFAVAGIR